MEASQCRICKTNTLVGKGIVVPEYFGEGVFEYRHCHNCDGLSVHFEEPVPSNFFQSTYERIYSNSAAIPGYTRYAYYSKRVRNVRDPLGFLAENERMYFAVKQYLRQVATKDKPIRILEVGCGYGYLVYALRQLGYEAFGIDISKTAVDQALENFGPWYINGDATAPLQVQPFDLIIATEVIEHITDPSIFIKGLSQHVLPGGVILITTPEKEVNQWIWSTDLPPVHWTYWSKFSVRQFCDQLGMPFTYIAMEDWKRNVLWELLKSGAQPTVPPVFSRGRSGKFDRYKWKARRGVHAASRLLYRLFKWQLPRIKTVDPIVAFAITIPN